MKCWTVPNSVDSVLNATSAVLVFSMIFTFPYGYCFLFSGLCLKSFISHAVIIFNFGVSFVCVFFWVPFLRLLKGCVLVKSFLIHRNLLRKNMNGTRNEIRKHFLSTNRIRTLVFQAPVNNVLRFHKIAVNKFHALEYGVDARTKNIGFGSSQFSTSLVSRFFASLHHYTLLCPVCQNFYRRR
nr:MAG TPA: hypothetical protein [Caudoviricetes sp.]